MLLHLVVTAHAALLESSVFSLVGVRCERLCLFVGRAHGARRRTTTTTLTHPDAQLALHQLAEAEPRDDDEAKHRQRRLDEAAAAAGAGARHRTSAAQASTPVPGLMSYFCVALFKLSRVRVAKVLPLLKGARLTIEQCACASVSSPVCARERGG